MTSMIHDRDPIFSEPVQKKQFECRSQVKITARSATNSVIHYPLAIIHSQLVFF